MSESDDQTLVTVTPMKDGPVMLSGSFEVVDSDGTVLKTGPRAALCRCGQSGNKPFCDGTHSKVGFES